MPTRKMIREALKKFVRAGRGSQKARAGKRADAKVARSNREELKRVPKTSSVKSEIKKDMTRTRRLGRMDRKGTSITVKAPATKAKVQAALRGLGMRKSQKSGMRQSYSTRRPRRK